MESAPYRLLPEIPAISGRCRPTSGTSAPDSERLPTGCPGMCPKTRLGKKLFLKSRGVPENFVGVGLGRDLWVDLGNLPGGAQ
jgi:hypothetical protein